MSIMIPERPRQYDPASREGAMFDALAKLPDDYYVIHSFSMTEVTNNTLYESETDFVIYHQQKGILCLEAKAGKVSYSQGCWRYANGDPMSHDGPFQQASNNKWKLLNYIKRSPMFHIAASCKFLHAVWFPSLSKSELASRHLPPEADRSLILTQESLLDPINDIERIFSIELTSRIETCIDESTSQRFIREVLCPQFNVFPAASQDTDLKKIVFHRLLKEQSAILNFLEDQRTVSINGAAGTGKTMIAIEKAKRSASNGERVLFLCYNVKLKDYLSENYAHESIDFYTIAGLACKFCNTFTPDYSRLKTCLEDMYYSASFPYVHIIVDEAQDFSITDVSKGDECGNNDEASILGILHDIIADSEDITRSFYVFYDKLQLVQGNQVPKFLVDADCKLTLYRNCRNTQNIATTSLCPITERKPMLMENAVVGAPAKIYFSADTDQAIIALDAIINNLKANGIKDIVILTLKTESTSILSNRLTNGKYRNKYLLTTCRKFKGLEADAIILVDITEESFDSDHVLLYYVGASRARIELSIVTALSDQECEHILFSDLRPMKRGKSPRRDLAKALNSLIGVLE